MTDLQIVANEILKEAIKLSTEMGLAELGTSILDRVEDLSLTILDSVEDLSITIKTTRTLVVVGSDNMGVTNN
jgi:hypothetical protein